MRPGRERGADAVALLTLPARSGYRLTMICAYHPTFHRGIEAALGDLASE